MRRLATVRQYGAHWRLGLALVLFLLLGLPPVRHGLEDSMTRHMLLQMPLLVGVGLLAGYGLPAPWRRRWRLRAGGSLPLVLTALLTTLYWMMPRAMDAAITDPRAELLKFFTLPLLAGLPLALSWPQLPAVARGLVWTHVASMLAVLGWLYMAAPIRVCNVYLESAQYDAGRTMATLAVATFLGWLVAWLAGVLDP